MAKIFYSPTDPKRAAAMADAIANGASYAAVATKYGISRARAHQIVSALKPTSRVTRRPLPDAVVRDVAVYADSLDELAHWLRVRPETARAALDRTRALGVVTRRWTRLRTHGGAK